MYKKIKNSSFMNLIWFIIAIMPILLVFIYSITIQNNSDTTNQYSIELENIKGNTQQIINNTIEDNAITITKGKYENGIIESVNNELDILITFQLNNITNKYLTITNLIDEWKTTDIQTMDIYTLYLDSNNTTHDHSFNLKNLSLTFLGNKKGTINFNIMETIEGNYTYSNINDYVSIQQITLRINKTNYTKFAIIESEYPYFNQVFFNNYNNYVANYKNISMNSTPISYNYNNIEYNLETNNNNYLSNNQLLNINAILPFNNELTTITLNYNNYNTMNNLDTIENLGIDNEYNSKHKYFFKQITQGGLVGYRELNETQTNNLINDFENYKSVYYQYSFDNPIESTMQISAPFINNNYTNYLENILISIQSNGFISNAFLNLSQYFGVTNVYYSLACYYIEYLLVIVLLHLAFDILYMLPNICHKFMEKLGGERD